MTPAEVVDRIRDDVVVGKRLARNVSQMRIRCGFSQAELARRAGVSVSMVSKIERCSRGVSPKMMAKIASAFGVDVSALYADEVVMPSPPMNPIASVSYAKGVDLHDDIVEELEEAVQRFNLEHHRRARRPPPH